jgi:predicted SnoaL-like aldol condensation-catalyzing enzyme
MVIARFPDMRVIAEDILVDGDRVAIRSSIMGTTDPDEDPPTLMEIFRVENGRLAEMWGVTEGPRPS